MPYDRDGNAIEGGPHTYPEMAVAGLWTTPSDLALFALAIPGRLGRKTWGDGVALDGSSDVTARSRVLCTRFCYRGKRAQSVFLASRGERGIVAFLFAYEKGDGLVLMSNGQNSKALGLEIIDALAKQYGWTEFPTESTFSNPWIIGLIFASISLITYLVFRISRHRKRFLFSKLGNKCPFKQSTSRMVDCSELIA